MLILGRRSGESIVIGDEVEIVVKKVEGKQVWLGINAPRNISVHRREIYEKLKELQLEEAQRK